MIANNIGSGNIASKDFKLFKVSDSMFRRYNPYSRSVGRPQNVEYDIQKTLDEGLTAVLECSSTGRLKGFRKKKKVVESVDYVEYQMKEGMKAREIAKILTGINENIEISGNESTQYVIREYLK